MKLELGMSAETKNEVTRYETCPTCVRHPFYPNTLPVTLHRGGECLVCHGKGSDQELSDFEVASL